MCERRQGGNGEYVCRHTKGGVGKKKGGQERGEVKEKVMNSGGTTIKISFWDKVLGSSSPLSFSIDEDLDGDSLVVVQWKDGNKLLPRVSFSKKAIQALLTPWKDALVVKLLC